MRVETMQIDLDKLEDLFSDRYKELNAAKKDDEFFINYCDEHGIVMIHHEWVREAFNDPREDKVCILSPEDGANDPNWLLVPREFAERAVILGILP